MGQLVDITQVLYNLLASLGIFFVGIAALWFVSVYKDKGTR